MKYLKPYNESNTTEGILSILDYNVGLLKAVKANDYQKVLYFLNKGANPATHYNTPIQEACKIGNLNIVKALIKDPRVDPAQDNNYAFNNACKKGYTEIVKLLLQTEKVIPNEDSLLAATEGNLEIVKLLIEEFNVKIDPTLKVVWSAINNKKKDIVFYFLTRPEVHIIPDNIKIKMLNKLKPNITYKEYNEYYLKIKNLWSNTLTYEENIQQAIQKDANILKMLINIKDIIPDAESLHDLGIL